MLDELWSAQYLAPGTLCAFAGETATATTAAASEGEEEEEAAGGGGTAAAISPPPSSSSSSSSSPPLAPAMDFTHALHMRFPNAAAAAAFIGHGAFSAAAERAREASSGSRREGSDGGGGGGGGSSEGSSLPLLAVFSGRVDPPSLEALFRRGPEWESGIEHALLLSTSRGCGAQGGSGGGRGGGGAAAAEGGGDGEEAAAEAAADLFVSQLRELAESSLVGAVQSTSGRVVALPSSSPPHYSSSSSPHRATHAILTRFAGPEQLRAFLELPPVKALLSPPPLPVPSSEGNGGAGGEGGAAPPPPPPAAPVRAVASAQYNIAPAQGVTGRQGA